MVHKKTTVRRVLTFVVVAATGLVLCVSKVASRETMENSLVQAACEGNFATVKELLEQGVDANAHDHQSIPQQLDNWLDGYPFGKPLNTTALVEAAARGHMAIVCLLIQNGANVNAHCLYQSPGLECEYVIDTTALVVAAMYGHTPIVRYLVHSGADVNFHCRHRLTNSDSFEPGFYTTALQAAREAKYIDIVHLLE